MHGIGRRGRPQGEFDMRKCGWADGKEEELGWAGRCGVLGRLHRAWARWEGAGLLGLVFVACVVFGAVGVGEKEEQEQRDGAEGVGKKIGEQVGEQVGELVEGGVDGLAAGAGSYG